MTSAILLGAMTGVGLWALLVWAAPPRPALREVLRHAQPADPAPATPTWPQPSGEIAHGWRLVGRPAVPALRRAGLPRTSLHADLRITATDPEQLLTGKAAGAVVGLLTPPLLAGVLTATGVAVGIEIPVLGAVGFAAVGFLLPDITLRREAHRQRHDARHALSAYLDLVVISLAGGAGVEAALTDAARIGDGPLFTRLRDALDTARLTRTSSWDALDHLGTQIALPDLTELAATTTLAGTEGARVRASLAARAQTLRTRLLTDTEAASKAATERLGLPWGLLLLGFLVLLGYPALQQISASL